MIPQTIGPIAFAPLCQSSFSSSLHPTPRAALCVTYNSKQFILFTEASNMALNYNVLSIDNRCKLRAGGARPVTFASDLEWGIVM